MLAVDVAWEDTLTTSSKYIASYSVYALFVPCTGNYATLQGLAVNEPPVISTPFIPVRNAMDPASAIIGIVSFGFTVFAKVNEIRKEINSAPEQVRALQQACIGVELLLSRLDTTAARTVPCPPEAVPHFERLCAATQHCLEDVNTIIENIIAQSAGSDGDSSTLKIRLRKWLSNKDEFKDASAKLKELRETLAMMMDFMNSNYLEFIASQVRLEDSKPRPFNTNHTTGPERLSKQVSHGNSNRATTTDPGTNNENMVVYTKTTKNTWSSTNGNRDGRGGHSGSRSTRWRGRGTDQRGRDNRHRQDGQRGQDGERKQDKQRERDDSGGSEPEKRWGRDTQHIGHDGHRGGRGGWSRK